MKKKRLMERFVTQLAGRASYGASLKCSAQLFLAIKPPWVCVCVCVGEAPGKLQDGMLFDALNVFISSASPFSIGKTKALIKPKALRMRCLALALAQPRNSHSLGLVLIEWETERSSSALLVSTDRRGFAELMADTRIWLRGSFNVGLGSMRPITINIHSSLCFCSFNLFPLERVEDVSSAIPKELSWMESNGKTLHVRHLWKRSVSETSTTLLQVCLIVSVSDSGQQAGKASSC